jgi:hypothetical protein
MKVIKNDSNLSLLLQITIVDNCQNQIEKVEVGNKDEEYDIDCRELRHFHCCHNNTRSDVGSKHQQECPDGLLCESFDLS